MTITIQGGLSRRRFLGTAATGALTLAAGGLSLPGYSRAATRPLTPSGLSPATSAPIAA